MLAPDRVRGALLGTAIGDALGMPLEGLSHQNVRTYYKGVRGFVSDEKRGDLAAGQWTHRTQLALHLATPLSGGPETTQRTARPSLRRLADGAQPPYGTAPAAVAALAIMAARDGLAAEDLLAIVHDQLDDFYVASESLAAAFAQAEAVRACLEQSVDALDPEAFVASVAAAADWAESRLGAESGASRRLLALGERLDFVPLDLQECCNGTGSQPDEAWPFAVAMFARNPGLVEPTLLAAVNVGGDTPTIGACVGALLGALHGAEAFPSALVDGVEGRDEIDQLAVALLEQ